MKTRFYYLTAVAAASFGVLLTSCETKIEEKIVEKEVIVETPDNSDAALMGLYGNPKSIVEEFSTKATQGNSVDLAGDVSLKSEYAFNANRNMTSSKNFKPIKTGIAVDEKGWVMFSNPELKEIEAATYTYNTEGQLTGVEKTSQSYTLYITGTLISEEHSSEDIDPWILSEYYDIEEYTVSNIEWRVTGQQKIVTTIDLTAKKATRITSFIPTGSETWEEINKEVLDLDENGRPNEFSKEQFSSKAFADTPATKLMEKKDAKGNWILRYTAEADEEEEGGFWNKEITKRTIVYY